MCGNILSGSGNERIKKMNTLKISSFIGAMLGLFLSASLALAVDDCLNCHKSKTPATVALWQGSAHGGKVTCAECHGNDHAAMLRGEGMVPAAVCGKCHEQAFHEHSASRHGMGLHSGWGCTRNLTSRNPAECRFCHEEGSTLPKTTVQCARFQMQSAEMREIGCNRCHRVESSCASCHTGHMTDAKIVRDPGVCAKCHMGPDHPQWEMWQTSQHGTLYPVIGAERAPDCQRCHMSKGTHNVSFNITATPGGVPFPEPVYSEKRQQMLTICSECHAKGLAQRELTAADAVRVQSTALTVTADKIVWDLYDRGKLQPMPADRPPHPLSGPMLVTDSQLLYEDTSAIERLLFKMKKYDWAKAVKGAYHQNPAYAHWYGNAELKMDLIDIRSEATRLLGEKAAPLESRPVTKAAGIEEELRVLKKRFERKELTEEVYLQEKAKLLDGM